MEFLSLKRRDDLTIWEKELESWPLPFFIHAIRNFFYILSCLCRCSAILVRTTSGICWQWSGECFLYLPLVAASSRSGSKLHKIQLSSHLIWNSSVQTISIWENNIPWCDWLKTRTSKEEWPGIFRIPIRSWAPRTTLSTSNGLVARRIRRSLVFPGIDILVWSGNVCFL